MVISTHICPFFCVTPDKQLDDPVGHFIDESSSGKIVASVSPISAFIDSTVKPTSLSHGGACTLKSGIFPQRAKMVDPHPDGMNTLMLFLDHAGDVNIKNRWWIYLFYALIGRI